MKISGIRPAAWLSFPCQNQSVNFIRRVAGYEANRNFIDREWYDEAHASVCGLMFCPSGPAISPSEKCVKTSGGLRRRRGIV